MALTEVPSAKDAATAAVEVGPDTSPTGAITPRRRYGVFAIVGVALFMSTLDMTIITVALSPIHRDLHAALNWTGWSITAFTLGMLVTQPVAGRISDQFGRKRIFLICTVLFTVSSLGCGLSTNIYELIAIRVVQAIGGGGFMPSATGIVADHFGENRDRAVAMFTSILPLGGLVGPVLGGVFVAFLSWRWIFFVNVPLGVMVFALAIRYIPHSRPKPGARADLTGAALLGAVVLCGMLGVTGLGDHGASPWSPLVVVPVFVAVSLGVLLARHLKRVDQPIIPTRLFSHRPFFVMNVLNTIYGGAMLGVGALVPLYAEDRYHLGALDSGTVLTARAVGTIAVAGITSFLLRRVGYRLPMTVGFITIFLGSVMLYLPPHGMGAYLWLAIATAITGLGMGAAMPATNNATLALATENIAVIAGMRGMFRSTGSLLSVEIMTAILNRSSDPGIALATGTLVTGAILLATVPFIYTVPDHRGNW